MPCDFCVCYVEISIYYFALWFWGLDVRSSFKDITWMNSRKTQMLSWGSPLSQPCDICSSMSVKLQVFLKHWNSSQTGFLCFPEFWLRFLVLPSFSLLIWYLNGKDPIIFGLCLLWNSGCLTANGIGFLKPLEFRGAGRSWCSSLCQCLCCSWPWLWKWGGECVCLTGT